MIDFKRKWLNMFPEWFVELLEAIQAIMVGVLIGVVIFAFAVALVLIPFEVLAPKQFKLEQENRALQKQIRALTLEDENEQLRQRLKQLEEAKNGSP
jgi:uncharacterized protein HemX